MATLIDRFEAKVDRSGEHHLWTGSKKADGTRQAEGRRQAVTAQRVAWQLAHGPVPPGTEVMACPETKACVRIEHLSLRRTTSRARGAPCRSRSRGGGSRVEVRPGVWKLSVSAGRLAMGCSSCRRTSCCRCRPRQPPRTEGIPGPQATAWRWRSAATRSPRRVSMALTVE
ncbi:MAG: HNH endonuclease, partial [Acidimicrobiales bacterium]